MNLFGHIFTGKGGGGGGALPEELASVNFDVSSTN